MPAGAVPYPFGACRICQDKATGVHYGVATCEGCKGFFKRSTTRGEKYKCFFGGQCDLTPQTRNRCKSCRYKRCLEQGMSVEAVKMGRIPKVEKEKALEAANTSQNGLLEETAADTSLTYHSPQKTFLPPNDIKQAPMSSFVQPPPRPPLTSTSVHPNLNPCCWGNLHAPGKEIQDCGDTNERIPELGSTFSTFQSLTGKLFGENGSSSASTSGNGPQYSTSVIQVLIEKLIETPPLGQWMEQNFEPQIPSVSQSFFNGNSSNCNDKTNSVVPPQFERKTLIDNLNTCQSMDFPNYNENLKAREENGPWLPCYNNSVKRKQFPSDELLNMTADSNSPCTGKLRAKFLKNEDTVLSNFNVSNNFQECNGPFLQGKTTQSNPENSFGNNQPPTCTKDLDNCLLNIDKACSLYEDEDEEISRSVLEVKSPPLVTFDGGRASPESARLIESTTKRLQKPTELLFSPIIDKREKIRKHLSKEEILPLTGEGFHSIEELFSLSLLTLEDINKHLTGFCYAVPGFKNLCSEDKTQLIKRSFLDIWMVTSSEFLVDGHSFLMLNGEMIFSRTSMEKLLPCEITKSMFKIAEKFNHFELTDIEKTILCIIQLTSTENVNLKDVDAVQQLNSHYLNILANQIQLNHGSKSGRILIDIFRLIPQIEKLSVDLFSSGIPKAINSASLITHMMNGDGGPPNALQNNVKVENGID